MTFLQSIALRVKSSRSRVVGNSVLLQTCEAGDSIKPGAQAPGRARQRIRQPMKWAAAVSVLRCRPLTRASFELCHSILGLAPQAICCHLLRRLKQHAITPLPVPEPHRSTSCTALSFAARRCLSDGTRPRWKSGCMVRACCNADS